MTSWKLTENFAELSKGCFSASHAQFVYIQFLITISSPWTPWSKDQIRRPGCVLKIWDTFAANYTDISGFFSANSVMFCEISPLSSYFVKLLPPGGPFYLSLRVIVILTYLPVFFFGKYPRFFAKKYFAVVVTVEITEKIRNKPHPLKKK